MPTVAYTQVNVCSKSRHLGPTVPHCATACGASYPCILRPWHGLLACPLPPAATRGCPAGTCSYIGWGLTLGGSWCCWDAAAVVQVFAYGAMCDTKTQTYYCTKLTFSCGDQASDTLVDVQVGGSLGTVTVPCAAETRLSMSTPPDLATSACRCLRTTRAMSAVNRQQPSSATTSCSLGAGSTVGANFPCLLCPPRRHRQARHSHPNHPALLLLHPRHKAHCSPVFHLELTVRRARSVLDLSAAPACI